MVEFTLKLGEVKIHFVNNSVSFLDGIVRTLMKDNDDQQFWLSSFLSSFCPQGK